jgi:hypothetical protein
VDLREIELGVMNWIDMAQDRKKWRAILNGNELSGSL